MNKMWSCLIFLVGIMFSNFWNTVTTVIYKVKCLPTVSYLPSISLNYRREIKTIYVTKPYTQIFLVVILAKN